MKVYYVLRYVVTVFGTLLFKNIVLRIYEGHKKGHLRAYLKTFSYTAYKSAGRFLENFFEATEDLGELEGARFVKLRRTCLGLHSLLPREERYSYSILMPVYKPKPQYFRRALIAALDQTAPDFELLVGFDGPQPSEVAAVIAALRQERPDAVRLKQFEFDRAATGGGISRVTNALAAQATKHFLVLMDHDDWIRPDLLFRYEQTLRMVASPDNTVMFCDEYKINERDETVDGSRLRKPDRPDFPYLFINWVCHCLMVPRHLWNHVGGLRPECDGSQDYDLSLRL
ncbi:MAG: glycosyltransferase, partial [Bdellovibrionales bacterium]|nr:glycosyltransferase [Bdellovibrionales bacterium]